MNPDKNCKDRVRIYSKKLAKFDDGTWHLCDVVTVLFVTVLLRTSRKETIKQKFRLKKIK
jgi:hypothetical protein